MVVESGATAEIMERPRHPYMQALLTAGPRYDRPDRALAPVPESVFAGLRQELASYDHSGARHD
jgi:peptide/nickel transport system ATP-binding protein